jgi:hypothetical protein
MEGASISTSIHCESAAQSIGLDAGPLWTQVLAATRDLVAAHFTTHPAS